MFQSVAEDLSAPLTPHKMFETSPASPSFQSFTVSYMNVASKRHYFFIDPTLPLVLDTFLVCFRLVWIFHGITDDPVWNAAYDNRL